ncbi:MAG: hypothetical protein KF764_34095 [Labilithrix sp.]|nr:hypothetical protein [Labilithrix sp.]
MPTKTFSRVLVALTTLLASCSSRPAQVDAPASADPSPAEDAPPAEAEPVEPGAPAPMGDPLPPTAPGEWTWFGAEEFGDAPRCMDGSKTGLGLNRAPGGAKNVVVFMQGGGACFDGQTCALADLALSTDHHDAKDFAAWAKKEGVRNVMNRERAENPFRDWDLVMIPYCSGDVFAGDNPSGFKGRPQLGYRNVASYLPRLASTFRDADQLVLTGMSAGGYGAAYNFVQFQRTFAWLDVTMIDDSGPNLATRYTPSCLQQKWKQTWSMDKTSPVEGPFPLGYDAQSGVAGAGLWGLFQSILERYPKNKFAFISHERDMVMRYFHGIGHSTSCAGPFLLSAKFFEEGLRDIRGMKGDNFSTFYGPGTGHPYFYDDAEMYDVTVDGITLASWLTKVVTTRDEPRRVPAQF